jgi:phosphate transport system permease protein
MQDLSAIIARRRRQDATFNVLGIACTFVGVVVLGALIVDLFWDGVSRLNWHFLSSFPSRFAEKAGVLSALVGSMLVMFITACSAIPLGIAAAVYLEEYGRKNWFTTLVEINIANLAGVPSIIYGLMALGLFIYQFHFGHSVMTGGLTLACLILPIIIVATREALRSIPLEVREAAYAMGASKWQVIHYHLLPYSVGGISTGVIIALSRAIGETAPLITVGALAYVAFLPTSPVTSTPPFVSMHWAWSEFTVLPIQMFNWVSRPQPTFHQNAAAAGIVLIVLTLSLNAIAIAIRYRMRKQIKW